MQIRSYDNLKSSDSEWIGDIPTHWDIKKLKFLAVVQPSNVDKKTVEGEEPVILCNYTDVYKHEYIDNRLDFMQASATKAEIKKFKVGVGDVIVTKDSESPEDIAIPACVAEEVEGLICGYHLTQIKPIHMHGQYLFRLFQSKGFNAQFTVAANGVTRFGLPQYAIANAFTPFPPFEEQLAIANFLDFKTKQIDVLISQQQYLLDKLAEKRTSLISHAVTKGLDPSVPMKDSGVEWLGDIPQDWKSISVRWLIRIGSGDFISNTDTEFEYSEEAKVPVVGGNGIMAYTRLVNTLSDCIVVGRVGAHCGNVHFIKAPSWITDNALRVKIISDEVSAEFLICALKAIGLNDYANKNAQPLITGEMVKNKRIALPSLDEQIEICRHVDTIERHIRRQTEKALSVIDKLQEYRSALITNAVTGKIDVRDFQVHLQTTKVMTS